MGNGKGLLVGVIIALLAVTVTAIGWSIHSNAARAEHAIEKCDKHCADRNAHPAIQGKIDVVKTQLDYVEQQVKSNGRKLDEIKIVIKDAVN